MKNKFGLPVLDYNSINVYYEEVYINKRPNVNHIFVKGCKDYLCCRVINNNYFGLTIKRFKYEDNILRF
jgi:hypothetical protein